MAVPFFLSVPLLLLLCQHGSGSLCSPENTYTDEGLPCAEVDALEKIIVSLGLPKPLVSHTYCSPSDDKSISFECGACNESTTNSCRRITSLVTHRLPLHGQIDESLSNLTHLTKIDLSRNQLHGTIPESLGKLTRLKTLRLGFNRLSGQIPPTLGNLEALETLDLQSNFLNDSIPPSLGKLMNLTILFLSYNMLSGRIPKELGNLLNLNILSLSENRLSGYLPQELGNLSKLGQLSLHSNSLTGTLPDSFVNLKSLHRLNVTGLRSSVSGNKLSGEIPPFIANFTKLTHLVLRNCSLTGGIPDYIGNNWKSLYYLDLSFNDLSGSIHKSLTNASLERLSLTNNKLNGSIPPWILKTDKADLSYNNFADFIKDNITDPAHHDSTEVKTLDPGKPNMDSILALNHSLFINCGGARVNAEGNPYDEDISTESFFSVPGTWAYSCSGDFIATNRNSSEFVKNMTSGVSVLYKTARFCPVSLKYYGFCLRKAIYTVELHFAETIYTRDEYYSSLGTRIFDVYIQKIEGSQHIEMAKGPNVEWKANSPAIVDDDNPLEIHFSRRGKGSLRSLNGPLVSAISSNLRHKIKLSVRKISPPSEQREKDELKSDMDRKISPPSEKREKDELKSDIDRKIYPPSKQREKDELKSDNFLDILKSLSPENLVRLVDGYSNKDLHLLIYEYMETGSLHKALFEQKHTNTETELDWPTRFDICLGIAKGLNYLHEEEEKSIKIKIVHGNLNAKNILLDKTLTPKLSDFGLATIYNEEDPFTAIKARGSRVYLAPEHALGKAITVKADVYSYGIVVLEIVSGKSNAEYNPNQEADFLLDTARKDATQIVANLQRQQVNSRVLRNCSLTGGIPDYIGNNWTALRYLDLSFNNLSGSIPQSLKNALRLVLTNNKLNGSIPPWILKRHKVDLSYNNFADFIKDNITDPAHHDSTEVKTLDPGKPNMDSILALSKKCTSKHHSLFINCGGASTNAEGNPYDEDVSTETFFSVPGTWAYSCSGDSIFEPSNSSDFVKKMTCGASVSEESLYKTARSLKYYGFCLRKGNYTVQLHFAETIYTWDEYYSSSGTRIFDVYIQGERQLKDLNIIEMAKGPNEAWKRNFTAIVDENPLEIHFFWAGKGSLFIPGAPNGPLVSAISVTPNFDVHDGNGKLSASQIAGITIGCAFAPLLLFLFAWQMGLLGNRELREKQIEVQNRSFTLQQIIDGTKNFSSKMEIGRGRFGVVYKANLPDQIKLAVKKISPPSEQREKDELKSEIGNLISLSHENLVQLLGGYSNKDLHLLIYEYMETGSLHKALFEQRHTSTETELNWSARFDICLGIAKGLNYLHEEEEKSIKIKIVHGNINAKNILLDKTLTAKLSDFGLATIYNEEDPFTAIKARGSRVYMAPEHALGKAITVKADVYSYGVVRVEIVSGESNTEYIPNQEADFLLDTNFLNDSIPQSLGSLKNLTTLSLSQNRLSGPLPRELGNLSKLEDLSCDSNNLTGRLPDSFVNLKSLLSLNVTGLRSIVSGNKLSGEIPPFIANFTNLTYLVLRNCSLTGGIPDYIGNNWKSLYYLDLSFNNLNGSIPQSLKNAPFLNRLLLSNNKLTGSIPPGILKRDKVDLSYNNFTGFIKDNITDPTNHNSTKVKTLDPGKPNMDSILALSKKCTSKHHSLFINCGGARTNAEGNPYDEDVSTETFFSVPGSWAYSCSGDLTFTTCNSSDFVKNMTCGVSVSEESLYKTARFCPVSLKYYGFCLRKGSYTVELHFAETIYTRDEDYSSLGTRIFDVYIQGERKLKDLNIIEMAKGPNEAWKTNFTAIVDDNNPLEIHFFWAGKGSVYNPPALIGPLVSAISVTPNFDVNDGKLSASQIAGITIGCAFAPLLLFLFAWQMGLLGNRELREIQIKVQNRPFTLQQIIDGTKNFSSKMEIEQRHTNTETELNWSARYDICLGIAKGLNYLHEEEEKSIKIKIVHGNINAQNILLDKTHTAKLSDFGLATIYNEEDPFTAIKARGSRVYMAPEHALGKAITVKADVYSYGVVVLEIVSGRSNTEYIPNQEADFLLDTAGRLHQQGRFLNLVDKKLGSRFDNKQALTLLHLAMECINQSPTLRPSMSEGERKLKDLNIIEMAKGPNEAWKTNFTAIVDDNNPLEIHFFWAGKGSLFNPPALNGPLVSAISVTPNFNVHDGKLSASQIAGITIGCAFAPLLLFLFVWKMRLLGNRELREKQIEVQNRSFTLQQIIDGTKNFSSKMEIGRGRFGVANLPDQIKLAVKKISPPSEQREKDELKSEIGNLTSLSHENLVQLFGGYSSKDLHLLIYEYMETGSLQKALFEQRHTNTETELHWSARFDICLGIAKGLNYLHEEEEKSIKIKIVHGNINAKNILLDKNQTAKLSDFGLATIYNEEDPFTAIKARGSRVYMAPEHALGKAITVKADVGHI
uniref:non-specific serine/threonine protein kinase n=1 Tax=Salix viminalis TaxID=40686 RepID=A0A6N2K777_SALVM